VREADRAESARARRLWPELGLEQRDSREEGSTKEKWSWGWSPDGEVPTSRSRRPGGQLQGALNAQV
jgi:hypothetical protein